MHYERHSTLDSVSGDMSSLPAPRCIDYRTVTLHRRTNNKVMFVFAICRFVETVSHRGVGEHHNNEAVKIERQSKYTRRFGCKSSKWTLAGNIAREDGGAHHDRHHVDPEQRDSSLVPF